MLPVRLRTGVFTQASTIARHVHPVMPWSQFKSPSLRTKLSTRAGTLLGTLIMRPPQSELASAGLDFFSAASRVYRSAIGCVRQMIGSFSKKARRFGLPASWPL